MNGAVYWALFIVQVTHKDLSAMNGFAAASSSGLCCLPGELAGGLATHTACRTGICKCSTRAAVECFLNVGFCLRGRQGPHVEVLKSTLWEWRKGQGDGEW